MKKNNILQIENLSFDYNQDKIIKNMNLQVRSGEFVFIIGESGSGKTSLIELIQGRRVYSKGSSKIYDKELLEFTYQEMQNLRSDMGIIFQDYRLIEDWTVFENIAYKLEYRGYRAALIQSMVEEWATIFGIATYLKEYPSRLSGGEQQRVNIVRAIVGKPKIVIADEPTANLDNANAKKVFDVLKDLNRSGTTVLMVTHHPEFIEESDLRVIKLEKGEKVYDQCGSTYFV